MDKTQQFEASFDKVLAYCERYAIPLRDEACDESLDGAKDEAIQNSLAWTWERWQSLDSEGMSDTEAEVALLQCAGEACTTRRRMGATPREGNPPAEPVGTLHDATMLILDELLQSAKDEATRRLDLITRVANRLAEMKGELRIIATLLMRGQSRVAIAKARQCSPQTIGRRCEDIAAHLEWTVLDWKAGIDEFNEDIQAEQRIAWAMREFGRLKSLSKPAKRRKPVKVLPPQQGCTPPTATHRGPYVPPKRSQCLDVSKVNRATYVALTEWLEPERWQWPWHTRQQPVDAECFGRLNGLSVK